jgi:NAD(P)-dependent dehydrogenase (short-subunit alcohol dehydrogenase family)
MAEKSQVVIITGGAGGIGLAFSKHLASIGHRVVIGDLRGAQEAAQAIVADGGQAVGIAADVVNPAQVEAMVKLAVDTYGGVDALINNAGIFTTLQLRPFEQIPDDEWMRVMQINTLGPFICTKAVLPVMRKQGSGRIVNIASTTPIKGTPRTAHYVASKGAVIAYTRAVARELGPYGITMNAIAPGFTLSEGVLEHDIHTQMGDFTRKLSRAIARDQVPEDLVGTAAFLISDGAAFITGQTIAVDGGSVFL